MTLSATLPASGTNSCTTFSDSSDSYFPITTSSSLKSVRPLSLTVLTIMSMNGLAVSIISFVTWISKVSSTKVLIFSAIAWVRGSTSTLTAFSSSVGSTKASIATFLVLSIGLLNSALTTIGT